METSVVRLPWGWKETVRDSSENVAAFDYYSAPSATVESTVHFFVIQKLWCRSKLSWVCE